MIERVRRKPRPAKPTISILQACADPALFGPAFRNPSTWAAWRAFLAALFGLPMTTEQLTTFRECTGRQNPPAGGSNEAWLVVGRRGGKSFALAVIACFLACFRDWKPYLQRGEKATVMVVAQDRKQARVIMRFVTGLLNGSPLLKPLITSARASA